MVTGPMVMRTRISEAMGLVNVHEYVDRPGPVAVVVEHVTVSGPVVRTSVAVTLEAVGPTVSTLRVVELVWLVAIEQIPPDATEEVQNPSKFGSSPVAALSETGATAPMPM
jgi:hypothetical protein